MKRFSHWIGEMVFYRTFNGLRSISRAIAGNFYGPRPLYDKTGIDYDLARQLYRNDGGDTNLGAGFCKPIIDRAVEFIGLPNVSSEQDENVDAQINAAIQKHWAPVIQQMFRNAMRDSKTWVRIWQSLPSNPLTTQEEREACCLEIVDPDRVRSVIYDPRDKQSIESITIVNYIDMEDKDVGVTDPPRGSTAQTKEHEVWEVITPDVHRYYDKTDQKWLDWDRKNPYGFVPMTEVFNEYDSTLGGGQSDYESVYPFVKAFHEVLRQTLQAHAYHSMPKLTFKVDDVAGFLKNNFPEVIGEDGEIKPGSALNWKGREVLFIGSEEEIGFVEIKANLGDSKTLLEFLIDCISIASETPEWAFMRNEGGTSQGAMNAQTIPFEKKIERKRVNFQDTIQILIKMKMVINGQTPERVELTWPEIRIETLVQMAQATQQLVMSFEVLLERKLLSDNSARETLRTFPLFRKMKPPLEEAKDAEKNVELGILSQPPAPADLPKKNGKGDTSRVPPVTGTRAGG